MGSIRTSPVAATLVALLIALVPATASAEPTTSSSEQAAGAPSQHEVKRAPQRIIDFWTKRRMRRAEPVGLERPERQAAASEAEEEGSSGARQPFSHAPFVSSQVEDTTTYPNRLHGKIFFKIGGGNFVCSGTVVSSEARNVAWTAGHCVFDAGGTNQYVENLIFVPGYEDGNDPYGVWPAESLATTPQWEADGNINFDLAAATLDQIDGQEIEDAIGSRGIAFNQPRAQAYDAYGYPAVEPFDGRKLWLCESTYFGDDPFYTSPGPAPMGIGCDMTGGSSGGGWVISGGYVTSLNSFGYDDPSEEDHLYGPYQGTVAKDLYASVDGATDEPADLVPAEGPDPDPDPTPAEEPPPPTEEEPPPPAEEEPPPPAEEEPPPSAGDTQAPQTTISDGPANGSSISGPTPTFAFGSSEPGSSFQCRLEELGFDPCESPTTSFPLKDGDYRFVVRAIDDSGNVDPTPASRAFSVDTDVDGLRVLARKKQRQKGKRVKVKVKTGAAELITGVGRGKIKIRRSGKDRSFKLQRVKKKIEANEMTVLRLKPKRKRDGRKIRRAIKQGKKIRAPISVRAKDSLGNSAPARRVIRLK